MRIWIINDLLPSVWESHSTTHSSAHVPQSVFPDELLKPILSIPLSNPNEWESQRWSRDDQGEKVRLLIDWNSSLLILSRKICALCSLWKATRLLQSWAFLHISAERVTSLLYNLSSTLGLSWPPQRDFRPEGDERVILRAVSPPFSFSPSLLLSLPPSLFPFPHPFSQIHTPQLFLYLLRA